MREKSADRGDYNFSGGSLMGEGNKQFKNKMFIFTIRPFIYTTKRYFM